MKNLKRLIDEFGLLYYDSVHFTGDKCFPLNNCCAFWDFFEKPRSLQNLISQTDDPIYKVTHTVATHAFALAVALKLNPIFIAGVNLPINVRDYNYINPSRSPLPFMMLRLALQKIRFPNTETDFAGKSQLQTLEDFKNIAAVANSQGISVFCLNKESIISEIPGISYLSEEGWTRYGF
jgi:hypothetical protein